MDQAQLDNFNKIVALTQEFLKDGFVRDGEPQAQVAQPPLFNLPPILSQQPATPLEELLRPTENRPNSTLEKAAPFIRSLQDEVAEREKKKAEKKEQEASQQNGTTSSANQTSQQSFSQEPTKIKEMVQSQL